MFTSTSDPNDPKVVDELLSAIFETETKNYHSNRYALDVVKYYYGDISDEWFAEWIGTEDFRGGRYPDGRRMSKKALKRYENMYDLYWSAYSEWFTNVIHNIAVQNLRELQRAEYHHVLTNTTPWRKFGKKVRKWYPLHLKKDD